MTRMSDEVRKLIASCDSRRVVVELTEQVKVDDYSRLSYALRQLRLMGVRLAIDDTGAGFASLAHILKLTPDIIKLDRELTSGIDHRSEEHTSELQSPCNLVCRLLLEKKN